MAREDLKPAVRAAKAALEDKFGEDIVVLDIAGVSIMAEYFIIATANNPNQLRAMQDAVEAALEKNGLALKHSEGVQTARWILLDFIDVIVHLFCREDREYYRLEQMWNGASEVTDADLAE